MNDIIKIESRKQLHKRPHLKERARLSLDNVHTNKGAGTKEHAGNKQPPYVRRRIAAVALSTGALVGVGEATDYGDRLPIVHEVKQGISSVGDRIDRRMEHLNGPPVDTEELGSVHQQIYDQKD